MIWLVLILILLILALLEMVWMPAALKALKFKGTCDIRMSEPGQSIIWNGTVENHSRLPIPFVRLQELFPAEAQVLGNPDWIKSHCKKGVYQWYVEEKMALRPWQRITRSVRVSLPQRGVYTLGEHKLSAGDILGVREGTRRGDGQQIVVIPERSGNQKSILALGGFLGDISVRRFILEDPVLTVGFRDYTGREPMKAISWTRTAMTGTMQVKQFDHTAEQTVMVLLNVDRGTPAQIEECFRLTRTVCEELERKKIPFSFRTNGNLNGPVGKLFWLADGLGSKHIRTILYALGQADYTCFRSFNNLVRLTLKHRRNNESYIVILPSMTEEAVGAIHQLRTAAGDAICVLPAQTEVDP